MTFSVMTLSLDTYTYIPITINVRAEDWNLANPLQTCAFRVERRGDALVIEFVRPDASSTVFAQSSIDLSTSSSNPSIPTGWCEPVVDSSRYFVLKITQDSKSSNSRREAFMGFGFRSRDEATDFREALQHYEKSMQRQHKAATSSSSSSAHKPVATPLAPGETISVGKSGGGSKKSGKSSSGAVPVLSKKPPPPAASSSTSVASAKTVATNVEKITFALDDIDLDGEREKRMAAHHHHNDEEGDEDSSEGAVYEGDESQWADEFAMN
jgi:adaptin ear-binding coat-associated protein 1/2